MHLPIRVPSRTVACVCLGLASLWTTIALADVETAVGTVDTAGMHDTALLTVDWNSLFLAEFAVGGPIDNPYADSSCLAPYKVGCAACATGTCTTCGADSEAAMAPERGDFRDAPTHRPSGDSLWSTDVVFETEATATLEQFGLYNQPRSTGRQQFRANPPRREQYLDFDPHPPVRAADPLRQGEAATEILKLRRAIGVNPIAGTIFDASAGEATAWAGDATAEDALSAVADDRALAETICLLEATQNAAAESAAPCETNLEPEALSSGLAEQLRPAERKLEEAAELLEKVGQFERADAIRELAQQVRQDARQCERQGQQSSARAVSSRTAR